MGRFDCIDLERFCAFSASLFFSFPLISIMQKASEVMRAMLRLSETKTIPTDPVSVHFSFTEASKYCGVSTYRHTEKEKSISTKSKNMLD